MELKNVCVFRFSSLHKPFPQLLCSCLLGCPLQVAVDVPDLLVGLGRRQAMQEEVDVGVGVVLVEVLPEALLLSIQLTLGQAG